ncbi:putative DNA repair protein Rad4 [Aspergillus clavatus NRRL 1]|uniref:DNA repair protein Rad4, putative n=1 Tax=Aspergillus clavatus (strain ATCC 1007 / CBS 513.65 / DSM 816 / NCTC 3887 / NRRL 1 / QM 1276 / 107) TaxID=344612 RepID=A1CEI7_ASPCL|nr:DNA repair protein Rad4, putative [Aspergillus clavatus NRRL 1]EAW11286.1 DNA repair protein Rad4, putative [Aspergillus clavatus NRRL 1]
MRRTAARSTRSGSSRGLASKRREESDDDLPQVYREMLAEAEARDPDALETERPIKKRKVGGQRTEPSNNLSSRQQELPTESHDDRAGRQVQTVVDDPTSDESDMEWEEVDLQQAPNLALHAAPGTATDEESLQITLDDHHKKGRKVIPRQKPLSAAEKKLRLDIHKVHLLCLLRHVQIRNLWCNDDELQSFLKRMLSKQMVSMLNASEDKPQYSRSTTFVEGLNQASDTFNRRFRVTKPGLKRAHWIDNPTSLNEKAESIMTDAEVFLSREDFIRQAKTMQGSRDFGTQLFCALLRSAAVEARLVCSLQPLPFSGTTKTITPIKPKSKYIIISSDDHETSTDDQQMSGTSPTPGSRAKRLGRPQFTSTRPQKTSSPVFWVEAFNEALQKWVPIDPLVTKTIAKASKFEPPFSDPSNCMTYVVGFEEDASARDVTRRYAKAFNAKTRKLRVESTKDGERWWARAMQFYEKPFFEDRDELEISELTAKTAAEPMPRNVQDFKDHPIYALERQLRRNEVVFPKRVIGQVSLGKSGSKDQMLEPVYRRSDIHVVRSADKWYRLGRDIKLGEQPLKRIPANKNKVSGFNEGEDDNGNAAEVPLYAYFQTEIYKPPPVMHGKVPKNSYGNLDVYVPSMVPPGGIHIRHANAAHAARILGIDYAEAVTGFEFRGRHGTAVFQGIVIASEYQEALEEVLMSLEDAKRQAESEKKSAEMLSLWKNLLLRLRIAERVKGYAIEGEDDAVSEESASESARGYESETAGGGFFPEPGQETATPSGGMGYQGLADQDLYQGHAADEEPPSLPNQDECLEGGFIPDDDNENTMPPTGLDIPIATRSAPNGSHRYSLVVVHKDRADGEQLHQASEPLELELAVERSRSPEQSFEGSLKAPMTVDSSAAGGSKSASVEVLSRAPSQTPSQVQIPEEVEGESEPEDNGSLLSHDPEDDDAIPEWLV